MNFRQNHPKGNCCGSNAQKKKLIFMNEKILIADDHYVVRAGTCLVLETAYPRSEYRFC